MGPSIGLRVRWSHVFQKPQILVHSRKFNKIQQNSTKFITFCNYWLGDSLVLITEITKKCSLFVLQILENSFPQKVRSFPQKVKWFSSYQNQFPWKVKSMNIHFLTRSNERKTISLEGQIIFFSQKSISSKGQMIFHLTFGGKKIPRKVKFDLQRLDHVEC